MSSVIILLFILLIRNFKVRTACTSDYKDVESLVQTIDLHENLLADLAQFNKAKRDPVSANVF